MPSPGSNSETIPGKFHFLCENYTEELTFSLVSGGVRNRGGTNEQFCGAVKYSHPADDEKAGSHWRAAIGLDPLTSSGINSALADGIAAAKAVIHSL